MNLKNFKAYKKLIALINAGIIFATPVIGNTEEVKAETKNSMETVQVTNNSNAFGDLVVIEQEKFAEPISTLEQFNNEVNRVCNYLVQYINYQGNLKDFKRDVQCLYYLTNREHITGNLEKELINSHAINEVTQDDWSTLVFAIEGKNIIDEYNQSTIQGLNNTINISAINYPGIDEDEELLNAYFNTSYQNIDNKLLNKYFKKINADNNYRFVDAIREYNEEVKTIDATKVITTNKMHLSKPNIDVNTISFQEVDSELLNKYLKKVIKDKNYTIINAIYDYNKEVKAIDATKVIFMGEMCLSYDQLLNEYLTRVVNGECDLFTAIAEYNERIINETKESLIDVSEVCYDEHDRALLHDMHENYFNAYLTGRFMNFGRTELNESFVKVFKQLTTLNARENAGNAFEVSMGSRWLAQQSLGNNVMQLLRDDMQDNYTREELDQYFDKALLNQGQWWMREDVSIDINCPTDLELEVFHFGQLWWFCYDTVNIEMFESFGVKLDGNTK